MVATLIRIRDVSRLIALLEPAFSERSQDTLMATVEERTDITCFAELETGEGNGRAAVFMMYSPICGSQMIKIRHSTGECPSCFGVGL